MVDSMQVVQADLLRLAHLFLCIIKILGFLWRDFFSHQGVNQRELHTVVTLTDTPFLEKITHWGHNAHQKPVRHFSLSQVSLDTWDNDHNYTETAISKCAGHYRKTGRPHRTRTSTSPRIKGSPYSLSYFGKRNARRCYNSLSRQR